ncbi:MAG: DUF5655 domain-containing protein [Clostridia bacterium]|nr:DUF5655 domain-containing protein [Clostridia bacterium]
MPRIETAEISIHRRGVGEFPHSFARVVWAQNGLCVMMRAMEKETGAAAAAAGGDAYMDGRLKEEFFAGHPVEMELYDAFLNEVMSRFDEVRVRYQKTQVTFSCVHNFAFVSLPRSRMKSRKEEYIIVSFGLKYRLDSPRAEQAVNPYPNRWTHHVIVSKPSDIDGELMDWIAQSYAFSRWGKKRGAPG